MGNDLSRIVHEIDKLLILLTDSDNKRITPELVEQNIGISKVVIRKTKTEFDVVDVQGWVQQEDDVPAL